MSAILPDILWLFIAEITNVVNGINYQVSWAMKTLGIGLVIPHCIYRKEIWLQTHGF